MDDKKTEVSKEKATISSEFASSIHEESNGVSQPTADNCDKKNITTDTDCGGSTKERYSAQDKQDATASASIDDEDFLLRLESSDEDALDSVGVSSSAKTKGDGKEYAILNKSETLFSDIESSDDSIVYEPKNKSKVSPSPSALAEKQPAEKEPSITAKPVNLDEEKKVIESEFDLVESDEEFFEDLPEKTTQLSQETISDKSMEEEGEEQRSATPLIDEEDDKATDSDTLKKIAASTNIECNLKPPGSPPSIITSDQSLDLLLESSVDIPDQIDQHSTDLPEEKSSLGVDEKEISTDSIPDLMEETIVLSSDTSKEESGFHQTDVVTTEDSVTSSKKAEKLGEALSTVHSECSENSKNLEKVTNGAENTPISSAILKNDSETIETDIEIAKNGDFESSKKTKESTHDPENISVNQLDQMKTNDETDELIAEEIILDGDDEIDEKRSEVKDSLASLEEEPMEIDETILDVSDVTEMETTEENTGVQCLSQNQSSKPIEKLAIEEQEINLELKKQSEEIKEVPIEQSTESSTIDNDKLTELDQMPMEIASHQEKIKKSNKEENLNKEADSKKAEVNIELGTIEIEETKADKQVKNSKLSADKEMEEVEPTEEDTMKKKTDEVVDLLEKPGDSTKSLSDAQNEIKKCAEITPSPADDHKENKEGIPKSSIEENIDKSSKTSEQCMEIQVDTVIVEEMKNTTIEGTEKSNEQVTEPLKKIEKQDEKSDSCVPDVTENVESEQTQLDTLKESHTQASNLNEEKLESSKGTVKPSSDESQEQPNGSTGNIESSKETVEPSLQESNKELIGSSEELESSKKVVDLLEESDSSEKHESSKESLETSKESSEEAKQKITENEESVIETLKSEDEIKPAEHKTESIEKQEPSKSTALSQKIDSSEMKESLKETSVSIETDSVEKEKSMKETAGLEEIDIIKKQDSVVSQKTSDSKEPDEVIPTKPSEVVVSYTETIVESVKTTVTTTETATDGAVEKVVEVATTSSESTKTKQTTKIDPDVIEIDDDDEEIQEKNKSEDSSRKDEKSTPSTCEKDLKDTKNDDVLKTTQNKQETELVTPMDIDEEITSKKPSEKPPVEEKSTNSDAKTDQESTVKEVNTSMKNIPFQVIDDDEEPLLMIDTSHKEDNDAESNCMDTETATSTPTTDSSSDGSLEVFYDKECVNYECKRASKNFYRATVFAMNYFKVSKKRTKLQFVCEDCYDRALSSYEELCKTLKLKQPLLHGTTFKCQEFVEIIDSSDEDESDVGEGDKAKDENALPKESIEMLEAELEGAIRKVMYNVDIQKQLSWTKQILQQRLTNIQEDSDFVSEQLRALQKKADHMHNSLYQCPKIKLRQLTPLDLNSGRMYNPESDNSISQIPLPGDIIRNPICVNELYYAVKTKAIASWVPCKVIEEIEGYPAGYNQTKTYKIRFTTKLAKYPMFKTVYAKHMAYHDPPNVRLPIGSRVIAYFDATSLSRGKEKMLIPSAFYPGIIAEPLKQSNKFRYLVFYDDGYFQYVNHKDVRLVCQASENVWEDVHHQSREFIHNYLTQYAVNRPMVQTQKGQSMLVDYNGKWIYARVIDVDCSLVQMLFEGQSRSEWIYRGSTRLGPVYKESNNLSQKNTLNATRRRTEPFIRYINGDDSSSSQQVQETEQPQAKAGTSENRSVAKKSVSRVDNSNNNSTAAPSTSSSSAQPVPTVRHLNNSTIFVDDDNKPKGKVVYYTARKNLPPRNYVPHICNPSCPFNITHNLSFYSPLAKPLLSGWERQVFRQKSKKFIVYRGPCGKRMRNIEELHRYLRVTDNELNVDNFDFSPDTNCLAEYVLEKCLVNKKDISCGKEKMPIPCVNYYDETMPPACEYSAVRIPTEGVPLNLDKDFLCGCDCEDDCSDKTKCACWQLTYAGAKYGMPTVPTDMVGYQYKRLYEHVPTGIYECNSRCKCKANCVNRVVQQPLQSKLQVFKTSNRGWGLRCINDVPRGSFICVYAGQMLTEQVANEGGLDAGDEYFAELDYIEVAEQIKEGYESDVQEPEEDEDLYNPEREDDDIDFRGPDGSLKDKEFNTRLRSRKGNKNSTDGECDSQERQVISFEPNKTMDTSNEPNEKPTIRKLFGRDESCYVMDAKVRGNLGRYFNHSCSPNLFVQNVFVDTHDLRFPWVAFFASTHIRAGTELTWNYNYEVGVVPGKVLYCQCGAPNCRQRLL